MTAEIPALAGFAVFAFFAGFVVLLGLMVLVQPIWCIIDCAVDTRRGTGGKVVWIILLVVFYGLANWFYGAFAASNRALRWLTRIAWVFLILLVVAFVGTYMTYDEFRRGIDLEWKQRGGMTAGIHGTDILRARCCRTERESASEPSGAAEGATHPQSLRLKNRFVAGDSGETARL